MSAKTPFLNKSCSEVLRLELEYMFWGDTSQLTTETIGNLKLSEVAITQPYTQCNVKSRLREHPSHYQPSGARRRGAGSALLGGNMESQACGDEERERKKLSFRNWAKLPGMRREEFGVSEGVQ